MKITKAIIPAAGLGTRFLPQTKAMPKEMLPIIDKPVIQLLVEELVGVGVTEIIIVTGAQKRAIEDHFDRAVDLEQALIEKGKHESAKEVRQIAEMANFVYLRQKGEPKGNARPVLNAAHLLGDEPFFVYFPDDFFRCQKSCSAQQMIDVYEQLQSPVLSLLEVEKEEVRKYGIVESESTKNEGVVKVRRIFEKPEPGETNSTLASVNGYILTADVLPYLEKLQPGAGGEIGISEGLGLYMKDNPVYGKVIDGDYYDCGSKEGYIKAILRAVSDDSKMRHLLD